jgi:hypothetical protein
MMYHLIQNVSSCLFTVTANGCVYETLGLRAVTYELLHSQCEALTLNNHHSPNVLYTLLAAGADFTNKPTYEA